MNTISLEYLRQLSRDGHDPASLPPEVESMQRTGVGESESLLQDLDLRISLLQTERAIVAQKVDLYRSLRSPIRRLLPEILGEIFTDLVDEGYRNINENMRVGRMERRRRLLAISSVSYTWRTVALSTPRLWSYLEIAFHRPRTSIDYASLLLERSRSFPMSLYLLLQRGFWQEHPSMWSLLLANAARWSEVSSSRSTYSDLEAAIEQFTGAFSSLKVIRSFSGTMGTLPVKLLSSSGLHTFEMYHSTRIDHISSPWTHITTLLMVGCYAEDIAFLLRSCRSLEHLTIGVLHNDSSDWDYSWNSPLSSLTLLDLFYTEPILATGTVSRLQKLKLCWHPLDQLSILADFFLRSGCRLQELDVAFTYPYISADKMTDMMRLLPSLRRLTCVGDRVQYGALLTSMTSEDPILPCLTSLRMTLLDDQRWEATDSELLVQCLQHRLRKNAGSDHLTDVWLNFPHSMSTALDVEKLKPLVQDGTRITIVANGTVLLVQ